MLSMHPYWFLRTMAGVTMDIGMTLLVINLMMTALGRPVAAAERPGFGRAPVPVGGAAR
jgi:cytochrome c oxidase cbb3-type subunit 1